MQIILLERVEKLGGIGDVVNVKDGFARNFLLPRKKALRANDANRRVFEANRERIEADNAERREAAKGDAQKVDGTKIVLIRQASNTGQLYGSVRCATWSTPWPKTARRSPAARSRWSAPSRQSG